MAGRGCRALCPSTMFAKGHAMNESDIAGVEVKKRSLMLDFSAIRAGGGTQLSMNFLANLNSTRLAGHRLCVVLPDSGPLGTYSPDHIEGPVYRSSGSLLKRAVFEYITLRRIMRDAKVDTIFTFFGPGLPRPSGVRSVVSIAYPIICYPESKYWEYASRREHITERVKCAIRRQRIRRADHVIVETEVMQKRIMQYLGLSAGGMTVLGPAVTGYVSSGEHRELSGKNVFLFLAGNAVYKNLWRLYDVAVELMRRGCATFTFLLSITREDWLSTVKTAGMIDDEVLKEHFVFTGKISPRDVDLLYKQADVSVNLSDLESFSNNYMEAWKAGIPVIASDRDFSRHICGASAVYVEPHLPSSVAEGMIRTLADSDFRKSAVAEGKRRLAELPSLEARAESLCRLLLDETPEHQGKRKNAE